MTKPKTKAVQAGSIDIPLSRAIDIDGAKITALRMREPIVDDQLAVQELGLSEARADLHMIANLCQITPADVGKLVLRDFAEVKKAFLGFIG
jgi:hypothetical protein